MPTKQEYLNLFSNFISQTDFSKAKTMVDLGCGSGVLSIIAKENAGFGGRFSMLDNNEAALECSKMNLELFGVFRDLNFQNVDMVDLWFPVSGTPDAELKEKKVAFYRRLATEL
jgi:methylase of polypeptide subunit release factors